MYNHSEPNWAEDEILMYADTYGVGDYTKFICLKPDGSQSPQIKTYGKYTVAYPDIENTFGKKIVLLVEVKSRKEFYQSDGYLGLKLSSYNSYDIVQKNEKIPVRIVYLIGTKDDYELFWCKLSEIKKMETHQEFFKDTNDKESSKYIFFHSEQMNTEIDKLFRL
jgi:hypothetical protein